MKNQTKKIILAALFAALTCAATMSIRIPTPGTGGYIHPGDAIVILSGIILGPGLGFLAAGIGSCMSDLLGGYLNYVPITFLIKGLVAGGIIDIILVAGGYFLFEYVIYGIGAAASVPANIIQGVSGLVISLILYPILSAVPDVRRMLHAQQ